jgi:hypothetical protein
MTQARIFFRACFTSAVAWKMHRFARAKNASVILVANKAAELLVRAEILVRIPLMGESRTV